MINQITLSFHTEGNFYIKLACKQNLQNNIKQTIFVFGKYA